MTLLILGLLIMLSSCSSLKVCEPVPEWILELPDPPTAEHLEPGKSTRADVAEVIGNIEKERRLLRDKLIAVKEFQKPCR